MAKKTTRANVKSWAHFAILLIVGFGVYLNSLHGAFQYDDFHVIETNPYVKNLKFFFDYFADGRTSSALPENSGYRPLCTLIFALCWKVGSGATWPFHLYKVLAHILVAWLSFQIASALIESKFRKQIAFVSALFFLVHPALSETVNYVSSTSSLQCALFYLAAFWFYLRAASSERKIDLAAMGVLLFCSLLTKEEGATFPLVLLTHHLIFASGKRSFKKLKLPLGIATAVTVVFGGLYLGLKPSSGSMSFAGVPRYEYFITQIWAWSYYLLTIFTPWSYSIEHTGFGLSSHFYEPRVIVGAAIFLFLGWVAWRFRRERKFLAFGIAWYFITLLPASSIFPLAEPINEHRYYLSYTLLFPALGYAFQIWGARFWKPRFEPVAFGVLALLFLVLSVQTVRQNRVWRDPMSLWSDTIKKDPGNGRAHNNLGVIYLRRGELKNALAEFESCAKLWPQYQYCHLNRHIALRGLGRKEEARKALETMLRLDSFFVTGLYYHAKFLYEVEQQKEKALEVLKKCNRNSSGKFVPCLALMTTVLRSLRKNAELLPIAEQALRIDPRNREAALNKNLANEELTRIHRRR